MTTYHPYVHFVCLNGRSIQEGFESVKLIEFTCDTSTRYYEINYVQEKEVGTAGTTILYHTIVNHALLSSKSIIQSESSTSVTTTNTSKQTNKQQQLVLVQYRYGTLHKLKKK